MESAPAPAPAPAQSASNGYTLTEVARHNDATSCWTAIAGSVYDVTAFIKKHPGGEKRILNLCGKDGTTTFTDQHAGQSRPENTLASYRIGALIE
jgi:cytochrome b involved in lipid metabolism